MWKLKMLLAGSGLIMLPALAADVTINVTGNVVAAPCSVTNSTVNVDLGTIQATQLANAGSVSAWKLFNLNLKNCPASTTAITATFGGTAAADDNTLYKNTGTATNSDVELKESRPAGDGYVVGPGVASHAFPVDADGTATLEMAARAHSVKGKATPGTIVAVSTVTFSYQ